MRTNKAFTLTIIFFIVILFIIDSHIKDLKKKEEKIKKYFVLSKINEFYIYY